MKRMKSSLKRQIAFRRYNNLKRWCEEHRYFSDIDKAWFIDWWTGTSDKCYYCGITVRQYRKLVRLLKANKIDTRKWRAYDKLLYVRSVGLITIATNMTLDRRNSFNGYKKNNIVKCCWICNSLKGQMIIGNIWKQIAYLVVKEIWEYVKKLEYEKYERSSQEHGICLY